MNHIVLNPTSIARLLGGTALFLVLGSMGGQFMVYLTGHDHIYGLVKLLYVDAENNIPTGFSVLLLLFSAVLLMVIASLERRQSREFAWYWAILSLGFFFMAADEAFSMHERLITPMRDVLGETNLGVFYFAWVLPYIVLILTLVPLFLRFLVRLCRKVRLRFLLAGILYIGGAIGFELIGGYFAEMHGQQNLTYSMISTVEESLEMAGVIVLIWSLLSYIGDNYKEVRFMFTVTSREGSIVE